MCSNNISTHLGVKLCYSQGYGTLSGVTTGLTLRILRCSTWCFCGPFHSILKDSFTHFPPIYINYINEVWKWATLSFQSKQCALTIHYLYMNFMLFVWFYNKLYNCISVDTGYISWAIYNLFSYIETSCTFINVCIF